jgi:lipoate-protein ligase B
MASLEQVAMETLKQFGIIAYRRRDAAAYLGLWHNGRKIVSMGVRITDWVTSFGFVINCEGSHQPSAYIRPCGIEGVQLGTLEEILGEAPSRASVLNALKESFASVFRVELKAMPDGLLDSLCPPGSTGEESLITVGIEP